MSLLMSCTSISNAGALAFRSPHSQILNILHPWVWSWSITCVSRRTLVESFSCQKAKLLLGMVAYLQLGWRCKKQPFTKIQSLYFASTRSGFPGRLGACSLNLNPLECKNRRSVISGFVFLLRIPDIRLERVFVSTMSIRHTICWIPMLYALNVTI